MISTRNPSVLKIDYDKLDIYQIVKTHKRKRLLCKHISILI